MTERLTLQQLRLMRPASDDDATDNARIEREYALGLRVRELRSQRRWTSSDLAARAGVSVEVVDMMELGAFNGRVAELQQICTALQAELELRISSI